MKNLFRYRKFMYFDLLQKLCIPVYLYCDRRHTFIDDDMSRDIFGDDGLAELNEALRQLEDIKLSLNTGSFICR